MPQNNVQIRTMQYDDINEMLTALNQCAGYEEQWEKYFNRLVEENKSGERITFLAFVEGSPAGYVNIIYKSSYPYFLQENIPEINDLYVTPEHRKKGVGKMLVEECEKSASEKYAYIGLGVGLYKDYGSAQRLYTKNGYVLDGNGLMYKNAEVTPGRDVFVDDDLLLYLIKKLS